MGWSLEYPFDPRYYAKYGYQSFVPGSLVAIPTEKLLRGRPPEVTRIDRYSLDTLKPIHKAFAESYNFALTRQDNARPSWEALLKSIWSQHERFIYRLDGAYCILELEGSLMGGSTVKVLDYAYNHPQGREGLFSFLGSFHGQSEKVQMLLPHDEPLLYECQEHVEPSGTGMQVRIVDVRAALEGLSRTHTLRFSLQVHDDFCLWNNGSFEIDMTGTAVYVKPWAQGADATLDIRTLALLVSGSISAEGAVKTGLFEGDLKHAEALASLAGGKRPYCSKGDAF